MIRLYCSILAIAFVAGVVFAAEPVDSTSYAYGHQSTLFIMAGENDLMRSHEDFEDYIRGLQENYRDPSQMNDSSYMISYMLGGMEAVFITDGTQRKKKEDRPPFHCIIAGLRKVGNGSIALPADTIAAMEIINRCSENDSLPSDVPEESQCEFFTAYGIMKAYQPGLQSYIEGLMLGTKVKEDRAAFATGMADVLEASAEMPETAYDIGRSMALSVNLAFVEGVRHDFSSFLAGAKAALGLGEQLIPREDVQRIIDLQITSNPDTVATVDSGRLNDFMTKLDIEPFTAYNVNWTVTAAPVAKDDSSAAEQFSRLLQELKIEDSQIPGVLMAIICDEDGSLFATLSESLGAYNLPDGFKWFCGRSDSFQTTVGIMQTTMQFKAAVNEAMVDLDFESGEVTVPWAYSEADSLKWAEFTEANIGRHIALGINGAFMYAPKVNSRISSGYCNINGLTPETINRLFRGAEISVNNPSAEEIEVFEMKR